MHGQWRAAVGWLGLGGLIESTPDASPLQARKPTLAGETGAVDGDAAHLAPVHWIAALQQPAAMLRSAALARKRGYLNRITSIQRIRPTQAQP